MKLRSVTKSLPVLLFLGATVACAESATQPPPVQEPDFRLGNALASGGEVTLRAEAESWTAGAPVALILENNGAETVGFNLCVHAVERRSGDQWEMLDDERACTLQLFLLSSGESHRYDTHLHSALSAGEYRFRTILFRLEQDDVRDVVSASFQVGG